MTTKRLYTSIALAVIALLSGIAIFTYNRAQERYTPAFIAAMKPLIDPNISDSDADIAYASASAAAQTKKDYALMWTLLHIKIANHNLYLESENLTLAKDQTVRMTAQQRKQTIADLQKKITETENSLFTAQHQVGDEIRKAESESQ